MGDPVDCRSPHSHSMGPTVTWPCSSKILALKVSHSNAVYIYKIRLRNKTFHPTSKEPLHTKTGRDQVYLGSEILMLMRRDMATSEYDGTTWLRHVNKLGHIPSCDQLLYAYIIFTN